MAAMKTACFCAVALLLLTVGASAGRELQQTTSKGNPEHVIDPWAPNIKYPPVTVAPGTVITFKWRFPNGVDRVPSGQCPSDFTPSPSNGIVVLAPVSDGGTFSTPPLDPGVHWFACPVPGHCPSGMIIQITAGPLTAG
ncbi:hypothetical protein COCSUDRAFT_52307 [Coccomyxa subellipsoidea C-169]|uniref:Cupredoxin n=1 Tax=Coccomyxa subellipsoidea (strain C-169) TaxID=574566 RepID=I0Z6R6_COCSC|nr:hypothetical protein COCSUDRAFT_52307 [Coccomyxa subellipsoidea C-169]EIE26335.1 hypothetical protein COCSUDRAFT_52307 [Coccomyxa subellipsoidea C-169]|eukprot:XP_005650879.1 hypothetical protein COCSUDRAFT_52307 [Coccomyxa subellipsoidea C-169]